MSHALFADYNFWNDRDRKVVAELVEGLTEYLKVTRCTWQILGIYEGVFIVWGIRIFSLWAKIEYLCICASEWRLRMRLKVGGQAARVTARRRVQHRMPSTCLPPSLKFLIFNPIRGWDGDCRLLRPSSSSLRSNVICILVLVANANALEAVQVLSEAGR